MFAPQRCAVRYHSQTLGHAGGGGMGAASFALLLPLAVTLVLFLSSYSTTESNREPLHAVPAGGGGWAPPMGHAATKSFVEVCCGPHSLAATPQCHRMRHMHAKLIVPEGCRVATCYSAGRPAVSVLLRRLAGCSVGNVGAPRFPCMD